MADTLSLFTSKNLAQTDLPRVLAVEHRNEDLARCFFQDLAHRCGLPGCCCDSCRSTMAGWKFGVLILLGKFGICEK